MRSLSELEKIQKEVYKRIQLRTVKGEYQVVVAMDDCGMAAGARQVMLTILDEIQQLGIENVHVIQTGCLGDCKLEPVIEVFSENQPKTTYVLMTEEKARRMVTEHLANHQVVKEFTIGGGKK
jgi:NADP-reducing hydrogenase subunit HndB